MKNDELTNKVNSALDDSVEKLDADTTRQLFEARQKALNELDKPLWWKMPMLKPAGAIAAGLVVFMLVSPFFKVTDNSDSFTEPTDIELMASVDNLEMVEELEMIQWLLESEDYAS
jgi:hypothetical protein